MTRIVGGAAKGRHLAVPPHGTRPTSDRAREALFNTLVGLVDVEGARMLDLFAGTGAVGLEALSRGAVHVTFVESDRKVATVLAANLATVGLPGAVLLRCSVESFLLATGTEAPFELVYADPPYAVADSAVAALLNSLAQPRWPDRPGRRAGRRTPARTALRCRSRAGTIRPSSEAERLRAARR